MMKKTVCLLFFLAGITFNSQAQSIDSLRTALVSANQEKKIDLLNEISETFLKVNLDSTEFYLHQALELGSQLNNAGGKAKALWLLGKTSIYKGNFDAALAHFYEANNLFLSISDDIGAAKAMDDAGYCLTIKEDFERALCLFDSALTFAQTNADTSLMIRIQLNLASVHLYQGNYNDALNIYLQAYELAIKTNNIQYQINALLDLGNFYSVREDLDKSLEYFLQASELIETQNGKPTQLHYCYNSIGSIYIKKEDPAKALDFGLKALNISKQIHLKAGLMENYNVLAQAYLGLGEYANAITYAKKGLAIAEEINIPTMIALCTFNLGQSYSRGGHYKQGLKYLKKSLDHFKEIGQKFQLAQNLNEMAIIYESLGDYESALDYQKQHDVLQDSLYSERKEKLISQLETKYQVKEKEAQLQLQKSQLDLQASKLSRQRILSMAVAVIACLLLIITVLAFLNIKRRKHVNQKLKNLDEAKNRFFSNITHEMRNPLTLIMAPLQNLAEKTEHSPFHAELKLAYTNSRRLLERVNEILDLSKLESGKMELVTEPVNLHDLTRRLFSSYQSIAYYRKIKTDLKFDLDKDTTVLVDIEKFEKILNNLILNAFKYTLANGTVSLKVEQKPGRFLFSVTDTGQGIHPQDLSHIFDRYYQTEQENAPARGGSGIGLTLANEYAKLFQGNLKVESELERGSTFTLSIPLVQSDKTIQSGKTKEDDMETLEEIEPPSYAPVLIDGEKPKLLIVEDDLEMSRYLEEFLSTSYNCTTVPDGLEALKHLKVSRVDMILSDIMMPGMDGFELRKQVRENQKWIRIPYVMLTARAMDQDKITGLQLGVDDYITKPFNSQELIARLNNLTQNKWVRDNFFKENPEEIETLSAEEALLRKAEQFVIENIDDSEFTTEKLAGHMAYSVRQLERLLKKHSGLTPNAFIREIRLQKAWQILRHHKLTTIKEVCYEVGLNNPAYFSSKFKERFGCTPGELLTSQRFEF